MVRAVRVEDRLHATLREIAAEERRPIGQVIEDAIQRYQKEKFWQGVQEDFARLRANPAAWKGYQDEVMLWDSTVGAGLEDEEPYCAPEEEQEISEHYARTYGG